MRIFAIGDLHLSLKNPKEMDVFGSHWKDHWGRISADWKNRVEESDVVLVPGDISWAMRLEDAQPDLDAIGEMPGRKVLIRGNHDYWWSSPAKIRAVLPKGMYIVQNDCVEIGDTVFCGTRGWNFPVEGSSFSDEDRKIYEREKLRLRMSLDAAAKKGKRMIVMIHYPPLYETVTDTEFSEIVAEYPAATDVVFGHLHGEVLNQVRLSDLRVGDVTYNLVSADYLDFRLKEIGQRILFRVE